MLPPGPPPLAQGTGILAGQVIDAATGKGVNNAVVMLAGSRRVMTTADGQFAFRNLPEGSHSLTASKSGYIDGAFGMRRPGGPSLPVVLADAERRGNLVIWLWRHGSIAGTIVDEAGEPLVGIQVTALRRSVVGGRRRFVPGGTGTTDDRGMYRIGRLVPGDYAVAMATSQVSVPAATVKQYEESAMSGPDLSRNSLLQAMFQIGGMPLMSGSLESRQVGDRGAVARERGTDAAAGRRPATLRLPERLLSGSGIGRLGNDGAGRVGAGAHRHRPAGQARADGESVGSGHGRDGIGGEPSGSPDTVRDRTISVAPQTSPELSPMPAERSTFPPCRLATTSSGSCRFRGRPRQAPRRPPSRWAAARS